MAPLDPTVRRLARWRKALLCLGKVEYAEGRQRDMCSLEPDAATASRVRGLGAESDFRSSES